MKKLLTSNINTLSYTVGLLISFIFLKLSIWFVVFLYPFFIYKIVTLHSKKKSLILSTFVGFSYFIILYSWATTTGIALSIYGAILSAITFLLATLALYYTQNKITNKYLEYLLWPIYYVLIGKIIFHFLFFGVSFFMHAPALLVPLSVFIGSGGVIVLIQFISISLGQSLVSKKIHATLFFLFLALIIIFCELYFRNNMIGSIFKKNNANTKPQITLIQTNKTYKQDYKSKNALVLFEKEYKHKLITAAENGSKIIIIPEDPFVFVGPYQEHYEPIMKEIENISKKYDAYIFFSVQRKNSQYKTESQGHVFSPENGLEEIYVAQKNYGKIAYPDQYNEGGKSLVYKTKYGNVLLLICFEELFREIVDNALEKDSVDYMIIVSNNQFLPDHTGIDTLVWNAQNLSSSYQVPVFMSSNIGPTMIFNQYGQVVRKLDYYTESEIIYSDQ